MHRKRGEKEMKVQRAEQIIIRKDHPKFKLIDEMCYNSKNLYNEANYIIRQEFMRKARTLATLVVR